MIRRLHDFLPDIKDYYSVTDQGEFYSDRYGKMKTRNKPGTTYQIINFQRVDGRKKTFRAHRLVLMAFKPVEGMDHLEVNHIDGNKANNRLENLEWVTSSENQKHAFRLGLQKARRGEASNLSKLKRKDVDKVFELFEDGLSDYEIAKIIGCSASNIGSILRGETWQV